MTRWYTLESDDELDQVKSETARAIYELAAQLGEVASALHALGNGDAATHMGAIEGLGPVVKEGLQNLSAAVTDAGQGGSRP